MKKIGKGTKIDKRVRVEIVVLRKACKHESLLQALVFRESVVITNGPTIGEYLVGLDTYIRKLSVCEV